MSVKSLPGKLSDFESPEQILQLIQNERLRWLIATMAMEQATLPGDPRPPWAIRAAVEFWRCCQDIPNTKQAKSESYRFGLLVGMASRLPTNSVKIEPGLLALINPRILTPLIHAEFANAPSSDAAQFYAGFSEGLKRQHFSPAGAYTVYLLFAIMWPEISGLKNINQIHKWFELNLGPNLTGTRDRIAKICQKLHLPLSDKGGRPRKKPRN
jgi:hypothetical protein